MAGVVGMREHVLMLCGLNLISCREEYVPLIGSRCGRMLEQAEHGSSRLPGVPGCRLLFILFFFLLDLVAKTCFVGNLGCVVICYII